MVDKEKVVWKSWNNNHGWVEENNHGSRPRRIFFRFVIKQFPTAIISSPDKLFSPLDLSSCLVLKSIIKKRYTHNVKFFGIIAGLSNTEREENLIRRGNSIRDRFHNEPKQLQSI